MLLKALSSMCKSCTEALTHSTANQQLPEGQKQSLDLGDLMQQASRVVRAQCMKKRDVSYRTAAVECLGDVVVVLKEDVFPHCYQDIISPVLQPVQVRKYNLSCSSASMKLAYGCPNICKE